MSPVFERTAGGSRYIYSAGVFRSYKDVLSNLNKVKKRGFRTAEIIAWQDGRSISVSAARKLESQRLYTVIIYPEKGQTLPDAAMEVIRNNSDKDLIKSTENGSVVFKVGPFEEKSDAEGLIEALKSAGIGNNFLSLSEQAA